MCMALAASVAAKEHYSVEKPIEKKDHENPLDKHDQHMVQAVPGQFEQCVFKSRDELDQLCLTHVSELSVGSKFE